MTKEMTKKKRCLVIVGNVASGKSSVCGGLVARFEHYRHLSLDTFRHVAMGSGQVREQAAHALGLQFICAASRPARWRGRSASRSRRPRRSAWLSCPWTFRPFRGYPVPSYFQMIT